MREAPIRVAVVMACFNRRETTLRCLRSLAAQQAPGVIFDVHLLDDASRDGTADAVAAAFPDVHVLAGDGDRFWGGGMFVAMRSAIRSDFDYMLWLNDDVDLYPKAIPSLIAAHDRAVAEHGGDLHVVSGAVQDPTTGHLTYSGFSRKNRWHPAQLTRIDTVPNELASCDTLNGNCVLVPRAVVTSVGLIDPIFVQQLGDIDYGYRITKAGGKIWVAPDFVGTCALNLGSPRLQSFRGRLSRLFSPHGLPLYPWTTFMWRHGGVLGLGLLSIKYVRLLASAAR